MDYERELERDEEIIGIVMAISVVSRRLARSLIRLRAAQSRSGNVKTGKDGQNDTGISGGS